MHMKYHASDLPIVYVALFRKIVYLQDDVVLGTLTVRENIMFSANMRLSSEIPQEEKERRVDETIRELGLSHVANSKVSCRKYNPVHVHEQLYV